MVSNGGNSIGMGGPVGWEGAVVVVGCLVGFGVVVFFFGGGGGG